MTSNVDMISGLAAVFSLESGLDERLDRAAGLFAEHFGSDQCSIYLLDEASGLYRLRAFCGSGGRPPESVGVDLSVIASHGGSDGAARGGRKRGRSPVKATDDNACFNGVVVEPLRADSSVVGALVLRYRSKTALSPRRKIELSGSSAILSAMIVRFGLEAEVRVVRNELARLRDLNRNMERLAGLADAASTFAHEIRSPLISIGGLVSRLRKKVEPGSAGAEIVDRIERETVRLTKLFNSITGSMRHDDSQFVKSDLSEILDFSIDVFLEDMASRGIDLVRSFAEAPLMVFADCEQLKVAFDNLIANAIQSMEQGGVLTVSTRLDDGWAVAEVRDTGGGIAPGALKSIFTPFFTTKPTGTGLGLSITSSIVSRHRGLIEAVNMTGGAVFRVRLPRLVEAP